jgi:hypothetical protein
MATNSEAVLIKRLMWKGLLASIIAPPKEHRKPPQSRKELIVLDNESGKELIVLDNEK